MIERSPDLGEQVRRRQRDKEQPLIERRALESKVLKLRRELWDKKSERLPVEDPRQRVLFDEPAPVKAA